MKKLDIRLLLVEDDTVIRNIYKQILSSFVSSLFVASDGQEGYDSYIENKPDLIITDIKMPVMNGLDMIKKIRENDKSMRIVIMSAYGESRFFINAIETGVKGFLIKPVDTDHLKNIIREQANDILLEKRLLEEENKRLHAEKERDKGGAILRALLWSTAEFFNKGITESSINEALAHIGVTTNVSRAYIFKVHYNEKKERVISQINEWAAKGIKPEIDNPELKNIPDDSPPFLSFEEKMANRQNLAGFVEDFDEPLRSVFESQNIKSIFTIPIYIKNSWWGFIGFDDCVNYRSWSDSEINALEMLAYILGGALYRKEVEEEMTSLNAELEERVYERTKELELEVIERKNAQILLKDSEEKYRLIYENANDGIFLLINSEIILINPKVSEIFQEIPRNIIGSKFSNFVTPEFTKLIDSSFNGKKNDNEDLEVQLLNGYWLEMKSTSIIWDTESAYLVFVSNITKRKSAEKELNELNKNLELRIDDEIKVVKTQQQLLIQKSKLESIGELSAGLAHEINQPLGGISMGLENILFSINSADGIDNTYLRNKIDILFKDIDRIQKIIEHVRLFSRDQESKLIEDVSVNNVIQNTLRLVNKQLLGNNINVINEITPDQVIIRGNQYRLEQVLLNIVSNARHAVNEKEKHLLPENYSKRISIELINESATAVIIITDNGTGIKKNIISKVFDPFFTTKSEEKGTGLGLSISYGIISEMNGTISIESEFGNFTKMIIKLPVKK